MPKQQALLQQQHDVLLGCEWAPWLEVRVSKSKPLHSEKPNANAVTLTLSYCKLKKGIDKDGREWTVNFNHVAVPFPLPKKAGESDSPAGDQSLNKLLASGRSIDTEYSYIPATPENIKALDNLIARFDVLHQSLAGFLGQAAIQESLRKDLALAPLIANA